MLKFTKMHGLGNDFAIFDCRENDLVLTTNEIKQISDRRRGIGCDQVIIIKPSFIANCKMIIFNADGSQSAMCGNATRCVASLLNEKEGVIESGERILAFHKLGEEYVINMGKASFNWEQIPLAEPCNTLSLQFDIEGFREGACVNVGNPHLVFFLENIPRDINNIGSYFEYHPLFPERININFATLISENHIRLKVWERGAGATLACGSGACAVAAVAYRKNLISNQCRVSLPGGDLHISIEPNGGILMRGPTTKVFEGYLRN